jgi:hypothetical protein
MADGMWKLHENGTFELVEPYKTWLRECKLEGTKAWTNAVVAYLEPRCPYTSQQLVDELIKRNEQRAEGKVVVFEEFVLEALAGDL